MEVLIAVQTGEDRKTLYLNLRKLRSSGVEKDYSSGAAMYNTL